MEEEERRTMRILRNMQAYCNKGKFDFLLLLFLGTVISILEHLSLSKDWFKEILDVIWTHSWGGD